MQRGSCEGKKLCVCVGYEETEARQWTDSFVANYKTNGMDKSIGELFAITTGNATVAERHMYTDRPARHIDT